MTRPRRVGKSAGDGLLRSSFGPQS
jgi:hypothetical protein